MSEEKYSPLSIIGSTEYVEIAGVKNVPAKIDTGADTSAVWATDIDMKKDGTLVFSLFGSKSPFYTGERLESKDYVVKVVRSSHGDQQLRYRVRLPLKIGKKMLETTFTLANRSRNHFPILVGRHTLEGNFVVDVSKSAIERKSAEHSKKLNQELRKDPYKFHQKYVNK